MIVAIAFGHNCTGAATYQAVMNHIFSAYIGQFLDVYLDDIMVYSNLLSLKKLHFLAEELCLLGRIVGHEGIRMDPAKVDSVIAWKMPTNRDLLRGLLGAVGYLADDLAAVRIPMAVLHGLTGDTVPYHWEYMHQRAFEDIKEIVDSGWNRHRVPIQYHADAEPVYLIMDGCATGIAGVVGQGAEWKNARVAAFYSTKLNLAQQNYP